MDIMKIKTTLMRAFIGRLIAHKVNQKFDSNIELLIEDLDISNENDQVVGTVSVSFVCPNKDMMKLLKRIGS